MTILVTLKKNLSRYGRGDSHGKNGQSTVVEFSIRKFTSQAFLKFKVRRGFHLCDEDFKSK